MTSRQEIEGWFDKGVAQGSKFMLVICDTYDWEDYPVYAFSEKAAREKKAYPGEMQRVMEVYDLSALKEPQLNKRRANCFAEDATQ